MRDEGGSAGAFDACVHRARLVGTEKRIAQEQAVDALPLYFGIRDFAHTRTGNGVQTSTVSPTGSIANDQMAGNMRENLVE